MVVRKVRAEALLQTLTQHPYESVVVFADDMNRLFRRAHPCIAEENKWRLLLRGVTAELFAGLVRNPPKIVAEFLTEGSTLEKALEMRAKQYNHNLVGTANANCVETMRFLADSLTGDYPHNSEGGAA